MIHRFKTDEVSTKNKCKHTFKRHHNILSEKLRSYSKEYIQKYHFNVLIMITTLYQVYIESE